MVVDGQAPIRWLQFGATTASGATTAPVLLGNGNVNVPVNPAMTGLPAGVAIHHRLVASNCPPARGFP